MRQRVVLALGRRSDGDRHWIESGYVRKVLRFEHAAPSGYRWHSRALGLGLDSCALAVMSLLHRGPFLATNPWIAVALRLAGRRNVAVIGIYATPKSRSFRLLRRILGNSSLVTTVPIEADGWNGAGGRAVPVAYGNTFGYERGSSIDSPGLTIFIGGTSDRDGALIDQLVQEVRECDESIYLIIVANEQPSEWTNGLSTVVRVGYVAPEIFGRMLSRSDIVFLPLVQNERAAGHMVMVGALEAGKPVASTATVGMSGYIDGHLVRPVSISEALLPQLLSQVREMGGKSDQIHAYWKNEYSREAFVRRVGEALTSMDRTSNSSHGWSK